MVANHAIFMPAPSPLRTVSSALAPTGTPTAIINKVQGELAKIIKQPEVRQKFGEDSTLVASTPAEFKRHFLAESARWKKLVEETGIALSAN